MKRFFIFLFISLFLLSSCAGTGKNNAADTAAVTEDKAYIDVEPKDVIDAVYKSVSDTPSFKDYKTMLEETNVTEQDELYYIGVNGIKYVSAVASEPAIQPSTYSFVVIKLQKGVDYDGQRRLIEQNLNKAKWVCMSCEEAIAVRYENFVAVIMCDKQTVDALEAAYLSVMEAYNNGSI